MVAKKQTVITFVITLLFIGPLSTNAMAQDAPNCATMVAASNDFGLERIKVTSPSRANESVVASYGVFEQQAKFSSEGLATLAVAITQEKGPIALTFRDGTECDVSVDIAPLLSVLRITLQWEMPVDLNLHVVEQGGVQGGKGDAFAGHSGHDFGTAGKLDLENDGQGVGPFQESYILPERLSKPSDIFSIFVENVTRTKFPSGEYCGNGQYAKVTVHIIVADRGKITNNKPIELPVAACNVSLSNREYYVRLPF